MKLMSAQLQAFHWTLEEGTVHAAARKLGLSQAAVTQRLLQLERELGATLFLRSRRGMTPTNAALSLQRYCQNVLDAEGEVMSQIQGHSPVDAPRLIIQGPSSLLRSRTIPGAAALVSVYPNLCFEFRLDDGDSGVQALKKGDADLVIVPPEEVAREFDSKRLRPEAYTLVTCTKWKQRSVEDIVRNERIVDFNRQDDMTLRWLKKFSLQKLARTERHFVNNTDALGSLVARGVGYTVLSTDFVAATGLESKLHLPVPDDTLDMRLAVAWYPRTHLPRFFKEALKMLV